jgi:hypothetical protein
MTGKKDAQNKAGGLRRQAEKIAPDILEDLQGAMARGSAESGHVPAAAEVRCL